MSLQNNNVHDLIKGLIKAIGDDPTRKGLEETPLRVVSSWRDFFSGYSFKPEEVFKVFDEPADEMVIIKDMEWYSTCEHHMVPFYGKGHIAYIPNDMTKKVIGASKLPRLLEGYSRRLQIQERIGRQVVEALMDVKNGLRARGAACVLEARHLCICGRGVRNQNAMMVTSALAGVFKEDPKTRAEFLQLIKG